jgi:hypothetical protein
LNEGTLHCNFGAAACKHNNFKTTMPTSPLADEDESGLDEFQFGLLPGSSPEQVDEEILAPISPGEESLAARVVRVCNPRRMLQRGEVSGALGDLGTFLPDIIALSNNPLGPGPPPSSIMFFSGFWSVW